MVGSLIWKESRNVTRWLVAGMRSLIPTLLLDVGDDGDQNGFGRRGEDDCWLLLRLLYGRCCGCGQLRSEDFHEEQHLVDLVDCELIFFFQPESSNGLLTVWNFGGFRGETPIA
ncbi:hypothetical protein MLD38_003925 [Melastoma candidum]|nr:hypothetical protein MLD38_003925 [Melastoma candidum]